MTIEQDNNPAVAKYELTCDATPCGRFMRSSNLPELLQHANREFWRVSYCSSGKVKHWCESHAPSHPESEQINEQAVPGKSITRGSRDPTGMLGKIVRDARSVHQKQDPKDMYDIEELKKELPFCEAVHFETHAKTENTAQMVFIEIEFKGGLKAKLQTVEMPPDDPMLIEIVKAASQQCLARMVVAAQFAKGKHVRDLSLTDEGELVAKGKRISGAPPEAPSLREVLTSTKDVITVDGEDVTSAGKVLNKRLEGKGPIVPSAIPEYVKPEDIKLDEGKVQRASALLNELNEAFDE